MYNYRGKVTRVVDGDTLDLDVDLGYKITTHQRFRLEHVDTPERGRKNFKEATQLLERIIEHEKDEEGYIHFRSIKTGKYGRWLFWSDPINMRMMFHYPYEAEHIKLMKKVRKHILGETVNFTKEETSIEFEPGVNILDAFLYSDYDYNYAEWTL